MYSAPHYECKKKKILSIVFLNLSIFFRIPRPLIDFFTRLYDKETSPRFFYLLAHELQRR